MKKKISVMFVFVFVAGLFSFMPNVAAAHCEVSSFFDTQAKSFSVAWEPETGTFFYSMGVFIRGGGTGSGSSDHVLLNVYTDTNTPSLLEDENYDKDGQQQTSWGVFGWNFVQNCYYKFGYGGESAHWGGYYAIHTYSTTYPEKDTNFNMYVLFVDLYDDSQFARTLNVWDSYGCEWNYYLPCDISLNSSTHSLNDVWIYVDGEQMSEPVWSNRTARVIVVDRETNQTLYSNDSLEWKYKMTLYLDSTRLRNNADYRTCWIFANSTDVDNQSTTNTTQEYEYDWCSNTSLNYTHTSWNSSIQELMFSNVRTHEVVETDYVNHTIWESDEDEFSIINENYIEEPSKMGIKIEHVGGSFNTEYTTSSDRASFHIDGNEDTWGWWQFGERNLTCISNASLFLSFAFQYFGMIGSGFDYFGFLITFDWDQDGGFNLDDGDTIILLDIDDSAVHGAWKRDLLISDIPDDGNWHNVTINITDIWGDDGAPDDEMNGYFDLYIEVTANPIGSTSEMDIGWDNISVWYEDWLSGNYTTNSSTYCNITGDAHDGSAFLVNGTNAPVYLETPQLDISGYDVENLSLGLWAREVWGSGRFNVSDDDEYHEYSLMSEAYQHYFLNLSSIFTTLGNWVKIMMIADSGISLFDEMCIWDSNHTVGNITSFVSPSSINLCVNGTSVGDDYYIQFTNHLINQTDFVITSSTSNLMYDLSVNISLGQEGTTITQAILDNENFSVWVNSYSSVYTNRTGNYYVLWQDNQGLSLDYENITLNGTEIVYNPAIYPREMYISAYDQDGLGIPVEFFKFYVNGSRFIPPMAIAPSYYFNLTIKSYFNQTVYSSILEFAREWNVHITLYDYYFSNCEDETTIWEIDYLETNITKNYTLAPYSFVGVKLLSGNYTVIVYNSSTSAVLLNTTFELTAFNFTSYGEGYYYDDEFLRQLLQQGYGSMLDWTDLGVIGRLLKLDLVNYLSQHITVRIEMQQGAQIEGSYFIARGKSQSIVLASGYYEIVAFTQDGKLFFNQTYWIFNDKYLVFELEVDDGSKGFPYWTMLGIPVFVAIAVIVNRRKRQRTRYVELREKPMSEEKKTVRHI